MYTLTKILFEMESYQVSISKEHNYEIFSHQFNSPTTNNVSYIINVCILNIYRNKLTCSHIHIDIFIRYLIHDLFSAKISEILNILEDSAIYCTYFISFTIKFVENIIIVSLEFTKSGIKVIYKIIKSQLIINRHVY